MPYPITPPLTVTELLRNIYSASEPSYGLGMRLIWWSLMTAILPYIYVMDWRRDRQRPVSRGWTFVALLSSLPWTPVVLVPCFVGFVVGFALSLGGYGR